MDKDLLIGFLLGLAIVIALVGSMVAILYFGLDLINRHH